MLHHAALAADVPVSREKPLPPWSLLPFAQHTTFLETDITLFFILFLATWAKTIGSLHPFPDTLFSQDFRKRSLWREFLGWEVSCKVTKRIQEGGKKEQEWKEECWE